MGVDPLLVPGEADGLRDADARDLHANRAARDGRWRWDLGRDEDVVEAVAATHEIGVVARPEQSAGRDRVAVVLVDLDGVRVSPSSAAEDPNLTD
jgi:hypothetical protein